ncbi:MAG: polyphosphate kinase 1 [Planctomycetota bacterium]
MAIRSDSESADISLASPERFLNRELSWLEFNARVLDEACSAEVPLLERAKFLAITTSNLDEFFMVRVAGLERELQSDHVIRTTDGRTSQEQLDAIALQTRRLLRRQYDCWHRQVKPALAENGIELVGRDQLTDSDRRQLESWYEDDLYPVLTPLAVDASHPFPVLTNTGLYLAVTVEAVPDSLAPDIDLLLIQVPTVLPRYVRLPSRDDKVRMIVLEEVIRMNLGELLGSYQIDEVHCFRVTRDSDLSLDDENVFSLPEAMRAELRHRRKGAAVRLEVERLMPARLVDRLRQALHLRRDSVYRLPPPLNLSSLFELVELPGFPTLRDDPMPPLPAEHHPEEDETWFDAIQRQDILLHHPFHSFDPITELLEQAAEDPKVLAIKQTLYRTSRNSKIIQALIRASEEGKQVTVLMEVKARFDEQRNLDWARKLEAAGAHVVYGVAGLKTHCKALLIIRREPDGIRRYVHLATGNYNENTARLYTDLGLLTARREISEDLPALFNVVTGYSRPIAWSSIAVAPLELKDRTIDLIEREARMGTPARPGRIVAKMNSLVDEDIIDALYRASEVGVQIDLIIRGICRLRPGVKGLSETIRVCSVVDRFLEHTRVMYFENGGDEEIYLSSADWMRRNFHARIEAMFPVLDEESIEVVKAGLEAPLRDNVKGWVLDSEGRYTRLHPGDRRRAPWHVLDGPASSAEPFRSQLELYTWFKRRQKRERNFEMFHPHRSAPNP